MIDSHAHLTDTELKPKIKDLLSNFHKIGGIAVLNVGHSAENNLQVLQMYRTLKNNPIKIYNGIGLHPEIFSPISNEIDKHLTTFETTNKALTQYENLVENNLDVLSFIGETGLDYYHFYLTKGLTIQQKESARELQLHSFRRHCEIALKHNLPMSIHVRDQETSDNAVKDALAIISEIGKGRLRGSFHSYTSNIDFVQDILAMGFYIGVNGIVTYKKADNVRNIVKEIPSDRLLLETDAPWLPPHTIRNNKKLSFRKGQPTDIFIIAETVAEVKNIEKRSILQYAKNNFLELIG